MILFGGLSKSAIYALIIPCHGRFFEIKKYFMFLIPTILSTLSSLGFASDAEKGVVGEKISSTDAKQLVLNVDIVMKEFKKNSTCTIEAQNTFSKNCEYFLFDISCTPGKNNAGLFEEYVVNKKNGDVKKLGFDDGLINQPGLAKLQSSIRAKNKISAGDVEKYRDISIVGCLAY